MSGSASTPSTSKQQELATLFDKTFLEMLPPSFAKIYKSSDNHSRMFRSDKLEQAVKKLQTLNFFEIPDQAHRKLIQDVSDLKAFLGSVSQQKDWAPTQTVYNTFGLIFAYLNIGNLLDYYGLTLENLTLFSISSEQRWSMLLADNARNPAGLFETLKAFGQECKEKQRLHLLILVQKQRIQQEERAAGTQSVPVSVSVPSTPKKITIGFGNDTPIHTPSVTNPFLSKLRAKETERAFSAPVGKPSETQIVTITGAASMSSETIELKEEDDVFANVSGILTFDQAFDDSEDGNTDNFEETIRTTDQKPRLPSPFLFHSAFTETQAEKKPAEVAAILNNINAKPKKKPAPEENAEELFVGSPWDFSMGPK
jgi:hypothetical protein